MQLYVQDNTFTSDTSFPCFKHTETEQLHASPYG